MSVTNEEPVLAGRAVAPAPWERVDNFIAGPADSEAAVEPVRRRGRRLLWTDGLVATTSEQFVLSFLNPTAIAFGATTAQMGLLSALANAGAALGLFPGARLVEVSGRRKKIYLASTGLVGRLILIIIALAPLWVGPAAVVPAIILLVSLRSFVNQLGFPAWTALVADIVPAKIRGRYFSARNTAVAIAALVAAPLYGLAAQRMGLPQGYQVCFAIAGIIGFFATGIFSRIPDPGPDVPAASPAPVRVGGSLLTGLRRHPRFLAFSGAGLIWNLGLMIGGPFFSVYLVRTLHATPMQIGLMATVAGLANIMGQRVWGQLNDRRGAAWVMRTSGLLIPIAPLLWFVMPNPWWLLLEEACAGFLWAGYNLSNFNVMLGLSPAAQRARYTAFYQMVVFTASFVGPLVGGMLASVISLRYLFLISAAVRFLGALLFSLTVHSDAEAGD